MQLCCIKKTVIYLQLILSAIVKIFLYIFLTAFSLNLFSQSDSCNFSVSGKILDVETKEPIPYVSVVIRDLGKGTIADEKG